MQHTCPNGALGCILAVAAARPRGAEPVCHADDYGAARDLVAAVCQGGTPPKQCKGRKKHTKTALIGRAVFLLEHG